MSRPHVLIVGGGLAGPSLALCLAKHNIRSTIFERRQHPGSTGGSITLAANALRALDQYVGVYEEVKDGGWVHDSFQAYLADGYKLGEIGLSEGGYPAVRIMRSKVHEILQKACEEQGRKGLISWEAGKNLVGVEESEDGVTARFEDGSEASGDILIGTDGVNSLVRSHVLSSLSPPRPNPTPEYVGTCIVVSFIPRKSLDLAPPPGGWKWPYMFFCPSGQVQITSPTPDAEELSLVITRKFPPRSPHEWKELAKSGEAARLAIADYTGATVEPLKTVLAAVDSTKTEVWAPYDIPDIGDTWYTNRVCLIGDAAHAMPPNGQGTAMAFEDAAYLSRLLSSHLSSAVGDGDGKGMEGEEEGYNKVWRKFTSTRRARVNALRESHTPAVISWIKDSVIPGPLMWFLKSWVFSAFFYFQGGTVHMKGIHDYDVSKEDIELD